MPHVGSYPLYHVRFPQNIAATTTAHREANVCVYEPKIRGTSNTYHPAGIGYTLQTVLVDALSRRGMV